MTEDLAGTPVFDRLAELRERDIVSFHTLPLSRWGSVKDSLLLSKHRQLLCDIPNSDFTYTGKCFDTPAAPTSCIGESLRLTAAAFGADHSWYVTQGTTGANSVVLNALIGRFRRVLLDRRCHQSIHLPLADAGADVTYLTPKSSTDGSGRQSLDTEQLLRAYRQAVATKKPFDLVILTGCSYEGVMPDMRRIIAKCIEIQDGVTFFIDEAWSALGYFHNDYSPHAAIRAARDVGTQYPRRKFSVIATQSAHKSLSAMRQGSYIHVLADERLTRDVWDSYYRTHTTSPSYPILASLELARAQAVLEGKGRIEKALRIADSIRGRIESEVSLAGYQVNRSADLADGFTRIDPLRLSVDLRKLTDNPRTFKEFALEEHGVYVNRYTETSFLARIPTALSAPNKVAEISC